MATNWERIDATENGPAFKKWLNNRLVAEETFNNFSFVEINEYRTKFEQQQQANGTKSFRLGFSFLVEFIRAVLR